MSADPKLAELTLEGGYRNKVAAVFTIAVAAVFAIALAGLMRTTPGYRVGDEPPCLQGFTGYAIVAGPCHSCTTIAPELEALGKYARPLVIFTEGGDAVPALWNGCPTAVVPRDEARRLNPGTSEHRLIRVTLGRIVALQQFDQTYEDFARE